MDDKLIDFLLLVLQIIVNIILGLGCGALCYFWSIAISQPDVTSGEKSFQILLIGFVYAYYILGVGNERKRS